VRAPLTTIASFNDTVAGDGSAMLGLESSVDIRSVGQLTAGESTDASARATESFNYKTGPLREPGDKVGTEPIQPDDTRFAKVGDVRGTLMNLLKVIAKPGAWASGWTSAVLCFSAASGFWLAGQHKKAIVWLALGIVEVGAVIW